MASINCTLLSVTVRDTDCGGLQNKMSTAVSSNGCSSSTGAPFCAVVQVYVEDEMYVTVHQSRMFIFRYAIQQTQDRARYGPVDGPEYNTTIKHYQVRSFDCAR